ncbi:hypothetical protein [Mesorhizobium sophorae]|uniref:hypothetical protein n=1 Tax=Mesorhizobium sophorae TaxID=1300294 RepID=UPI00117C8716|nr:hypothetical protein [Mesorhizobium sophorae]
METAFGENSPLNPGIARQHDSIWEPMVLTHGISNEMRASPTGLTSREADIAEPWADNADRVKTNRIPVQMARQRMSLGKEHSCAVAAIVMA